MNLETRTVGMARPNLLRTLYGFLVIRENDHIRVRTLESLGSWASRYSQLCTYLQPFTHAFFNELAGRRNRNCQFLLQPFTKLCIHLWRLFLCISAFGGQEFRRSFASFTPLPIWLEIEFDASLTGFGFILSAVGGAKPRVLRVMGGGGFPFLCRR